ncbi:MAG: cell division protein FtsQ [Halioglobus sp.]|nr:cell division protein FtsQ [Halioglobus sp.]
MGLFDRWRRRGKPPRAARGKRRRSAQGATPRVAASAARRRQPSVWFNRLLILVGAGVVLAAGGKAWVTLQAIPVQRITVTGELAHTQAEAVQEQVQSSLAGGFLGADLQRMRAELEALPWIFEATIRRRWPAALEIHVVEQLPIARWGSDGFLNHEGGVFHPEREGEWDSLPLLLGPEGSAPALMARYQRLLEMLAPLHLTVRQLQVDERGQVQAVLDGGMQLVLGSRDFRQRMQRFVTVYRRELAPRAQQVLRVDLRYASGVAVAFAQEPAPQEGSQVAGL